MNSIIIQTMKKLLTLSLTLVVFGTFAEISIAQICIQPPSGLVAWWPLDNLNAQGEYEDLAGNPNNGIPINNPQQIFDEYVGNSLQAGIGRYVEVPAANATNLDFGTTTSFTIDAWVKFTPGTQTEPIVHKLGGGAGGINGPGYFLNIVSNFQGTQYRLRFHVGGAIYLGPIITAPQGTWIFVAAVINKSTNTVNLYVGVPGPGNQLSFTTDPGGAFNASNPSNPFLIGGSFNNPHSNLGIDEVEIFNRPLSFTELDNIFKADTGGKCKTVGGPCVPPPNTTMVAWYPFDETTGLTAANLATGNTGTHINSPLPVPGLVAGALNFNGIDNYVQAPSTIVTDFGPANTDVFCQTGAQGSYSSCRGDFSIDAWIRLRPNAPNSVMIIVDKRNPNTLTGYSFFLSFRRLGIQLVKQI